jgi:NAD+ synthase (glutamine-hydrolysing)
LHTIQCVDTKIKLFLTYRRVPDPRPLVFLTSFVHQHLYIIGDHYGASYRLGPELEICGYGCEDHYYEQDTIDHCWESLILLFDMGATDGLLCDFGMPILHDGVRYNCRLLCKDRKILLIRPKTALADGGNYHEGRYFVAYIPPSSSSSSTEEGGTERHYLPSMFYNKFGQRSVSFGLHYLHCTDGTTIGCESCEELWTPRSTHVNLSLHGVEIIGNGSGSHHELRKLCTRIELMISATRKCGGIYLYANQRGCDGSRTYYDGCAMIVVNGQIVAQAPQFDVHDVNVVAATIDLADIRSYRASNPSFGRQAVLSSMSSANESITSSCRGLVFDDVHLCFDPIISINKNRPRIITYETELAPRIAKPEEECSLGPACWLWDYLRRSGATGFFLPLSGKL